MVKLCVTTKYGLTPDDLLQEERYHLSMSRSGICDMLHR